MPSSRTAPPHRNVRWDGTGSLAQSQSATTLVDRRPWTCFALLSLFFFLVVACMSSLKLLWLDELITLHIARLNSVHAIYAALAAGSDPNPPLIHLSVMLCRRFFGEHALALRLPATLGYWLGMLTLFVFLKRRIPAAWALVGTVMTMDMGAFEWSNESRSYAIFYGFTMLAFLCWTIRAGAAERRTRTLALLGLFFALFAALCTNYFAVLAFFPVAAAELTRSVEAAWYSPPGRRTSAARARVDWPVWLALALAATPLFLFRRLIETGITLYQPYAWNKVNVDRALYGYLDMVEGMRYPLILLVILAIAVELLSRLCARDRAALYPRWLGGLASASSALRHRTYLTFPEAAGVSVLLAYPFVGYAVAVLRGGMLAPRFVIPVCFGCAIVGVLLAYRIFGHLHRAASFALLLSLGWFAVREGWTGFQYQIQKESFFRVIARVPPPEFPGQHLVISDNLIVLPFEFYGHPQDVARMIYPIDFQAIQFFRGEASAEVNFWTGRNSIYHFPIIPLANLQPAESTYTILTSGREWLVADLRDHNYKVEKLPIMTETVNIELLDSPLGHGLPVFFRAQADRFAGTAAPTPVDTIPFDLQSNLPKPSAK